MKLPRDVSASELARQLAALGNDVTRQTGSHMRLTAQRRGEHHVTIPRHGSLRVGTLASIVERVAKHGGLTRDEVVSLFFGPKK